MPLTGTQFDAIIDLKSDNAYSGYFDTAKKNRIIREATNKAIDFIVAQNDRIQTQDNLFGINKTNVTFTPASNTLSLILGGAGISDYYHMMNMRCSFVIPLTGNYITNASSTTPIQFTLFKDSNLATGENVIISGATGNTNTNGSRYVQMLNRSKGKLYSDENLLTAVASNGLFSGTATISRVVNNYAHNLASSQKFSALNGPTYNDPYYEIASGLVKIYPLNWACGTVVVDYISLPVYIDVTDAVIDLYATYSTRFIDALSDQTIKLMGESSRDDGLIINAVNEINSPQ